MTRRYLKMKNRLADAAIFIAVLLFCAIGVWGLYDTINTTLATGVIP